MADITSITQGNVDDSDQVNWRGDQVNVPQGGQSIYDSSSIKLAQLGARKVVGDRVFRYALSADTIKAGDLVEAQPPYHVAATAGAVANIGAKVVSVYCITATIAKNAFADGYLFVESGTAAGMGIGYKVKSHAAVTTGTSVSMYLYDPIKVAIPVADKVGVQASEYGNCVIATTGIAHTIVGISPVLAASGEYYWLQTWGPAPARGGTLTKDCLLGAGVTGAVAAYIGSTAAEYEPILGKALMACTASHSGIVYLQIAP